MTELEQKAEQYAIESGYVKGRPDFWITVQAYIAGHKQAVKENAIKWHDLRKVPNDLPDKYRYVIAIFYDCFNDRTNPCFARLREDSEWEVNGQVYSNVVAWIEIPQF